jgi:hypothetical protein
MSDYGVDAEQLKAELLRVRDDISHLRSDLKAQRELVASTQLENEALITDLALKQSQALILETEAQRLRALLQRRAGDTDVASDEEDRGRTWRRGSEGRGEGEGWSRRGGRARSRSPYRMWSTGRDGTGSSREGTGSSPTGGDGHAEGRLVALQDHLGDVAQRLLRAEKQRIDHKREAVRALEQVLTYADVC